jgi:hypothetical protein
VVLRLLNRLRAPKWKHEDWKVRLKIVKELDDQEILQMERIISII